MTQPDWVIEVMGPAPKWVATGGGDPELTSDISRAERYATEREAFENMMAFKPKLKGVVLRLEEIPRDAR